MTETIYRRAMYLQSRAVGYVLTNILIWVLSVFIPYITNTTPILYLLVLCASDLGTF